MSDNSSVDAKDIAILRLIAGLRKSFEWVEFRKIDEKLPWNTIRINRSVKKLIYLRCLRAKPPYEKPMIKITAKGLDTLALWDLKNHGVVSVIGDVIGTGKEAIVLNGRSNSGKWVIIKLHRYYQKEFEKLKRSSSFAAIIDRSKKLNIAIHEIDIPRAKAQTEFNALKLAKKKGIPVASPLGLNRHVVVTEMIQSSDGIPAPQLAEIKTIDNPLLLAEEIAADIYDIKYKMGMVHGDLSEFNILLDNDGNHYFIDWPQAIFIEDEKDWETIFARDIKNISDFFYRKYNIAPSLFRKYQKDYIA